MKPINWDNVAGCALILFGFAVSGVAFVLLVLGVYKYNLFTMLFAAIISFIIGVVALLFVVALLVLQVWELLRWLKCKYL